MPPSGGHAHERPCCSTPPSSRVACTSLAPLLPVSDRLTRANTAMTSASAFRDRIHAAVSASVGRPLTWVIVVVLIAAWPIAWALLTPLPPRLPVLGTIPPFELT